MAYTKLMYHIVFSTKQRTPFLEQALLSRLCKYLGGITRVQDGQMLSAGGAADHVHLAIVSSQTKALADLVRIIKANSSRWIHQEFPDLKRFAWQDGYGAFSVSPSVISEVVRYIESQEAHHRKMSFQEEFTALLVKHGIEFDEKYIWA